jgi:hypothetical protein
MAHGTLGNARAGPLVVVMLLLVALAFVGVTAGVMLVG